MNSIAEKEKQDAAASSVVAAVFLTLLKLIVGLLTGSLGILSEAAHSGLDLVAALVTFFAVRLSDRPPDEDHLYGHGKIENLSALIETLLLLLTCAWIVYEAIQRLLFKSVEVQANVWAFAVMVISIVVDISRSRVLYAAARKYNSQALEADALHFSTDVWSSLTVVFGLALVRLGDYLGPGWEWLAKADAVAALGVALIVVYVSVQLGQRAIAVLLDAAPPGLVERIGSETAQLPDVQSVGPVRVRQSGALTFVDLSVGVDRGVSLEQAHRVAEMVESRIVALIPRGDVVVHVDPEQRSGESLPQTVSAIAGRLGLQTHNVRAREVRGNYYVNLHVEAPALMTLAQAHEQVSRLEATLCEELPYVKEVNSHIEPQSTGSPPDASQETKAQERLWAQVVALIERTPELHGCHNVRVWPGREGYEVVLHCLADPDLPVEEAHRLAHRVEEQLRTHVPGISRVLVHVEPEGEL
jgi:cation diffusion facilitator family transporter